MSSQAGGLECLLSAGQPLYNTNLPADRMRYYKVGISPTVLLGHFCLVKFLSPKHMQNENVYFLLNNIAGH
jgi:hypothetical protein